MVRDGITARPRKSGIDAFRLLCALGVISTHAGVFEGPTHTVVSLLSKWSVAYFFIVLGYFLGRRADPDRTSHALKRIFLMFLVASVLMLPLSLMRIGFSQTCAYLLEHFLINGTYFHLWYLNSLLLGLLVVRLTDAPQRRTWLPMIAIGTMVASLWLGSYGTEDTRFFGRHLMSVPLLWFGMLLSRGVPSMRQSVLLACLGLGVEVIESWVLHAHFDREVWQCPYLIGTLPLAVGLFGIAFNLPHSRLLERLGKLGGRYMGSIYVTHMYFLALVVALAEAMHVRQSPEFRALEVPLVFLLNISALHLLDRLAPQTIDLLLGDASMLRGSLRAFVKLPNSAMRTARSLVVSKP